MADNRRGIFPSGFTPFHLLSGMDASEPVLVAFSGGADSRALFDLTAKYCRENSSCFYACHVNHGIRGDEAIRDRDFCISAAKACPECREIFVLDTDVPALADESGNSLELEARNVRYEFFRKIMVKNGIRLLATAHNADDNLETMIFNFARGSGVRGMCGIPHVRHTDYGVIIRPMLNMTKSDILEYCNDNGLDFVTDSTNYQTDYTRNLIRARVVPLLEEINPKVRNTASRLADTMKEVSDHLRSEAESFPLSAKALAAAPGALLPEIISRALNDRGFHVNPEAVHIEAIAELCSKGKEGSSLSLPGSIRCMIENGMLTFAPDTRETASRKGYDIKLSEGNNPLPGGYSIFIGTDEADGGLSVGIEPHRIACLTARTRLEGDKILSGGMHKSVKKLMCDKKIPLSERSIYPMLCDDKGILWIPGVAIRDNESNKNINMKIIFRKQEV